MFAGFDNKYELSYFGNYLNYIILEEPEINDINPFLDLNENNFVQENQNLDNSSYFINSYCGSNSYNYNTNCETLKKSNLFSRKQEFNQEDESNYSYKSFEEIKNILKNNKFPKLCNKFCKSKSIKDAEYKLCNKKRKRENESFVIIKSEKEEAGNKNKRGRKPNQDFKEHYRKEHNQDSEDNIIKKIKAKLLLYPLKFLNNILEKSKIKHRLYRLDYKYTNQLKKEEDMKFLKMSLKELYSSDISPKYKKIQKNHNKIKINSIIENKDNEIKDYPTIMFALNLSFGDWIELFCYKKDIDEIIKQYEGIYNVNKETIKNNLIGVEDLLNTILKENDEDFSTFTFFLYNYKRWFFIKNERNKKSK